MVTTRRWAYPLLFICGCLQVSSAFALAPLGNGYSAVPAGNTAELQQMPAEVEAPSRQQNKLQPSPQAAAQSAAASVEPATPIPEPRLSVRMEQGADDILSRKDGVSAAVGAALTATLTSNPAAVLVGGLAGIWVGDREVSDCDCKKMQLGEKTSNLFRKVSKTLFKGGRYLVDGTKKLAKKTGDGIQQMRHANAPMPLTGQKPLLPTSDETAAVIPANPPAPKQAPAPAANQRVSEAPKERVKQAQPSVMTSVDPKETNLGKPAAKPAASSSQKAAKKPTKPPTKKQAKDQQKKKPTQQTAQAKKTPKKKTPVKKATAQAKVAKPKAPKPSPKPVAVQPVPVAVVNKMTAKPAAPKTVSMEAKAPIVRVSAKKLQPMPKLATVQSQPEPLVSGDEEQPWPEQTVEREPEEPTIHRVLKAIPGKQSSPPAKEGAVQAVKSSQALDCDAQGDKVARGRLAWMECYYRME